MPRLQRDLTVRGDLTVGRGGSVRRPATTHSFPFARELDRALPNRLADRLVGGEGVEPFGLRLALVAQEVNLTQRLTLRSQRRLGLRPDPLAIRVSQDSTARTRSSVATKDLHHDAIDFTLQRFERVFDIFERTQFAGPQSRVKLSGRMSWL